jgi:proteic killer suppression protein
MQARTLKDLRIPPGNRLDVLKGGRKGQHSIRITDAWRICFVWHDGDAWNVEIVNGKRAITADTALRLGKYFGVSPETWVGLQADHDLRVARSTSWPEVEKRASVHGE